MANEKDNSAAKMQRAGSTKYRDSSGKLIFEDPILCSQFLRGYAGIPMLKDVRPEDIEDVTERYVHLFPRATSQVPCLHEHLATAARVKYPVACCGVFHLQRREIRMW